MNTVGVVAGFGPYAATSFIHRLLTLTNAKKENEQFPIIAYYNTQIPSRTRALLYGEASPAPKLVETIKVLRDASADLVVVPCNSGHGWYREVVEQIDVEWLNMIEVTAAAVKQRGIERALVLSAYVPTTLRLYDEYLANTLYLKKNELGRMYQLIEGLKIQEDRPFKDELWKIVRPYRSVADGVILACTELSMLFNGTEDMFGCFKLVDSTHEYAKICVERGLGGRR